MSHGNTTGNPQDLEANPDPNVPSPSAGDLDGLKKVTILMTTSLHQEIKARARKRGVTVTELMRRAVALDAYLDDAVQKGSTVQIRTGDEVERLTLL